MKDVVSEADVDSGAVQVGAVIYRRRGTVAFPLNQYKTRDSLNNGIDSMKLMRAKDASLTVGMDTVREDIFTPEQGDRPEAPNVVIVLTDADATEDVPEIPTAADMLQNEDKARVFTAGIGVDKGQLGLAASSDDDVFTPSSLDELSVVKDKIVKQVKPRKALARGLNTTRFCHFRNVFCDSGFTRTVFAKHAHVHILLC